MDTPPGAVRLRDRRQTLQLRPKLAGQRDKVAIRQRHETALGTVQTLKQEAHLQHLLLVECDRAIHAEPVAILADPEFQLIRRD